MRRVGNGIFDQLLHRSDTENGLFFVDGSDCIANRRSQRGRFDSRFHHQRHVARGVLPEGKIHFQARGIRQPVEFGVAGYSHDGDPFRRFLGRGMAEHEALAHGILVGKKLTGYRGVDHRHQRSILSISVGKLAAALKRNAERANVSRADDVNIRMRKSPWLGQCHAFDGDVAARMGVGQGNAGAQGRGFHAGQLARTPIQHLLPEIRMAGSLSYCAVRKLISMVSTRSGRNPGSTESKRYRLFIIKSRANQKNQRQRNLRDGQHAAHAVLSSRPHSAARPLSFNSDCTSGLGGLRGRR